MTRHQLRTTTIAAVCSVVLALGVAVLALYVLSGVSSAACRASNVVQTEIYDVVARQSKGLASNQYFKDHPDQLAAAQKEVARELKTFAPLSC